MVAVHNDYRLSGEDYTFWLLTKEFPEEGITLAVRGEGHTDTDALDQVRTEVPKATRRANGYAVCSKCHGMSFKDGITEDGTCEACW